MTDNYVNAGQIAELIQMSKRHVAERVTQRKDFPKARRIGARRIWKASEVEKWIETLKEK